MRPRRTGLRVAAAGLSALFGLPGPALATAVAVSGASAVDRTLRDTRIAESSGLVMSRRTPGVVWTHNDSGNAPRLYAIGPSGATVGTARLSGVGDYDWEAVAPLTGQGGSRLLAIGDIGDNAAARSRIEIDVIPEPAAKGSTRVSPTRVIRLTYPGGAADAETLLADPRDGRLYVVTKGLLTSTVYAVPASAWPGTASTGRTVTAALQPIGTVNLTLVTDGAVLPDGRVLLRTYGTLAMLAPLKPPSGTAAAKAAADLPTLRPLATMGLPDQKQGEGLAVSDAGDGVLLLSSEGVGAPILRLRVPVDVWRAGASEAESESGSSSGASGAGGAARSRGGSGATSPGAATGTAGAGTSAGQAGGSAAWLITLAGGVAFAALFVIVRAFGRRTGGR